MAEEEEKKKTKEALEKELTAFKNAINVTPNSRSNLTTALANAASLLLQANALGLDSQVSELLQAAESQVKKFEEILVQELRREAGGKAAQAAAEEQRRLEEALDKAKIATFIAETTRLDGQHDNFKKNVDDIVTRQHQKEQLKIQALRNIKDSGKVNSNELTAILKTANEIQEEHEKRNNSYKHRDDTHKHWKRVHAHLDQLIKEKTKLQEEINLENVRPVKAQSLELPQKIKQLKILDKRIVEFIPIVTKVDKQKNVVDTESQKLEIRDIEGKELDQNFKKEIKQYIPEDHPILMNFFDFFENEENAIKDGLIKDREQREEFVRTYPPVIKKDKLSQEDLYLQSPVVQISGNSEISKKSLTSELFNDNQDNILQNLVADQLKSKTKNIGDPMTKKVKKIISNLKKLSAKSLFTAQNNISNQQNTKKGKGENHGR